MDFSESTKVVYNRIQTLEPEIVAKIVGYLLLQDHGERDMIRLAFSPDTVIHSLINKAKTALGISKSPVSGSISPIQVNQPGGVQDLPLQFSPFSQSSSCPISSPAALRTENNYWDSQVSSDHQMVHNVDFVSAPYGDTFSEDYQLQNSMQFLSLNDPLESGNAICTEFSRSNYQYPEAGMNVRSNRRCPSLPDFPLKVCHYFIKGFCKHGNNCRYFHGHPITDCFSKILNQNLSDITSEEQVFSPGSLEKLEMEITELLKSRRGVPISIASLPMLYYEKYGKFLQAEGYLTESQRHGKAGFSLTKLLAQLKNSIHIIDRPHGQHSVILAEDLLRYLDYAGERNDTGGIVAGSRQIYLTFPADSTFTEQDVSNYFNKYGPVQDVRIPCQQKRMFGFVTFVYPETVRQILSKGNPHFVCKARVLVKPYKEKSRPLDRKYADKIPQNMYYSPEFVVGDSEAHLVPQVCNNFRPLGKHFMEEHELALEFETRQISEYQLTPKSLLNHHNFDLSVDELKLSQQEEVEFPSAERFNYLLNVLNNGLSNDEKMRHVRTNYSDHDCQGLNLPDSPFASTIGNGISTVM